MTRETIILIVISVYMLLMIGVGFLFYGKNKNASDYILGGRKLNSWVSALSAQASDMSGWLLTGLPGLAYLSLAGVKEAWWTAIGLAIGTLLNWLFVAKRLRSYTEICGNALTLPDYLENRFRDKSRILRVATGIAVILFFLIYTSSMFVAGAKLFGTIFGLDYTTALIISSVIIVSYTYLGGFMAVCTTDMMQGILMFIAILVVPVIAALNMGGISETMALFEVGSWELFPSGDGSVSWILITSSLAWGLGYFGQPHILARFMAIRSPKDTKPATVIAMIWVVLSLAAAVIVGMVGKVYLESIGMPLAEGAHETVFMTLVDQLFPSVIAGILLSAILAAIMSTADSQLLVTSSVIASDLYKGLFKKNASDKEVVLVSRIGVLAVSVVAVGLAMNPDSSIFSIVSYAWAGLGASFGPAVLISLYWKRMTKVGAVCGVVVGAVGTIVFKQLQVLGGVFAVYELLPAFALSVAVIVVVSLCSKKADAEMEAEFDRAIAYAKSK